MYSAFIASIILSFVYTTSGSCKVNEVISKICVADENKLLLNGAISLNMTFLSLLLAQDVDTHNISIYYLPNILFKDECRKNNTRGKKIKLTTFNIKNEDNTVKNCSKKYQTVCCPYIFKGCFYFQVIESNGTGLKRYTKNCLWAENNLTINDIMFREPTYIMPGCVNQKSKMTPHYEITWILDEPSFMDGTYTVQLQPNNTSEKVINLTKNCTVIEYQVKCYFYQMSFQSYYYKIKFDVDNWKCDFQKTYLPDSYCRWETELFDFHYCNNASPKIETLKNNVNNNLFLYSVIPGLLVLFSLALFLFVKKKSFTRVEEVVITDEVIKNSDNMTRKCEILLVYGRDCQPFMDAMVELRLFLSELTGCEVYDIFDDSIYNDLSTLSTDFIHFKLTDENVKIVLIATEGAQVLFDRFNSLHENKYTGVCVDNCCNVYRELESLDHYVILTLKKMQISIHPKPFQKFFICRLPVLSECENFLADIFPHRRFIIPDQIQYLVQCLVGRQNINEIDNNLQPFLKALSTLREYKILNPDYLYNEIIRESFRREKKIVLSFET